MLIRQAGETGQLYGSVTARDIAEAMTAAGFTVERRQIVLDRPIKTLGLHPIRVALHPEVIVAVTVNVAKSTEEAEAQEKAGGFIGRGEEEAADLDELLAEVEAAVTPEAPAAEAGEPEAEKGRAKAKGEAKPRSPRPRSQGSQAKEPRPRNQGRGQGQIRGQGQGRRQEEGLIARLPLKEQKRPSHPTAAVSIRGAPPPVPACRPGSPRSLSRHGWPSPTMAEGEAPRGRPAGNQDETTLGCKNAGQPCGSRNLARGQ